MAIGLCVLVSSSKKEFVMQTEIEILESRENPMILWT